VLSLSWLLMARYGPTGRWRIRVITLLVACVVFTGNEWRWHHFESELADAAKPVLAGRDAGFVCERLTRNFFSSTGHVGHVWFDAEGNPDDSAFLSMQTCSSLRAFRGGERTDQQAIVAAHTLAHEAAHLRGIMNEAEAECLAVRLDHEVMTRLGASDDEATRAVEFYRTQVYPRLPGEYHMTCPSP